MNHPGEFFKQDTLVDLPPQGNHINSPEVLPKKIGPYPIEMQLSRSGMSVIYLGSRPDTLEPVIVKVLSPNFVGHPEMVSRFLKEAEIISLTHHPNIVSLYGQGEWEGGVYIAMELIQGISLRQMILQHSLTLKRSLEIVLQISYALFHLHAHGVIHRDLKPENIILTETGGVKVIDFGIAQLQGDGEETQDEKSSVAGTPAYMSPEQRENPTTVSYNSDIFSLGIITYELVLGQLSMGAIHLSLMPAGLQKILAQALKPNPKERYQDIVDFITDLNNYINSPEFQKEVGKTDYTTALFEELRSAQEEFLPFKPPQWQKFDIGLACTHHLFLLPIYFDFLELEGGSYAVLFAEASAKGASAILYVAFLKGLVTACRPFLHDPVLFMKHMNELVLAEFQDQLFSMTALLLHPSKNQLEFICCGFGALWSIQTESKKIRKIPAENIALGIDENPNFIATTYPWHLGDRLFMCSFRAIKEGGSHSGIKEADLQNALTEALFLPSQKQVDALLRKITPPVQDLQQEPPLILISLARTT